MLKNISNLGTTLNKSEQQSINGGDLEPLSCPDDPNNCCGAWYPGIGCIN